ncbi:hypothetical protein HNR60_003320 [Rhodopseudomonas rhenobacensis]|uniref:Sulfotransferase family protein n=1 Tax=Rhodopseudomonas rhenobacensis TaxID=87461 RepID=A0A7W7Z632_9BRAD|nr:sulfotransferase [Rhodopseudomonas rhenobacensis]MBB5048553.1 hypothetical protein [Rhodopseudomonas rhenobacensis]
MFFIFGSARSGTTLLAQVLSAHSKLIVPAETDFIVPANYIYQRVRDAGVRRALLADLIPNTSLFDDSLGRYMSRAEAKALILNGSDDLGELFAELYGLLAQRAGKTLAGDKSPNDLPLFPLLQANGMFKANPKVIHIVRDVRDSGASVLRLGWVDERVLKEFHARNWQNTNLKLSQAMQGDPNYFFLRYEDFATDPRPWCERLCKFLEFDFEPEMLEETRRDTRYDHVAAHSRITSKISGDAIGSYKNYMSEEEAENWTNHAKAALQLYGYA